jgi:hypothetical protein
MTCIRIDGAILTLADQSEPFQMYGRWWAVEKRMGPFPCNKNGDPSNTYAPGYQYQAAYEKWKEMHPEQAAKWRMR